MSHTFDFTTITAVVSDMDGVLWRGDEPLPGLNRFFDFLHSQAIPFTLATNNASKTVAQYQKKLAGYGIAIQPETVMTSSLATAAYLEQQFPRRGRVFVIGQDGITEAMRQAGFTVVADDRQPVEAVVAGIDFTLTYDKLKYAALLIRRGARFVGTNGDLTLPTEHGLFPGAGSILAAVTAATGVKPTVIGKPEPLMFEIAVQKMGSQPHQTIMIGDRLETDILGGQGAGLKTILVTTGVDTAETVAQKGIQPDLIVNSLDEFVDLWQNQLNR